MKTRYHPIVRSDSRSSQDREACEPSARPEELYRGLRARVAGAAVDRDRRSHAAASSDQGQCPCVAMGQPRRTRRKAGDLAGRRGGERRAIALANPSLGGEHAGHARDVWRHPVPDARRMDAPEHRHTRMPCPYIVEGEGVWTVVNRDAVRMTRGDFPAPVGLNWHAQATSRDRADGLARHAWTCRSSYYRNHSSSRSVAR